MNDEQILRKLAEIEGKPYLHGDAITDDTPAFKWAADNGHFWNPLTNWSDCGPLVEKYELCMVLNPDRVWECGPSDNFQTTEDLDLKRAICLAIIESKAVEKAA